MKLLDCTKVWIVLVAFVAAIVLGGGRTKADFTFGQRVNLGPVVNSPYGDYDPFISPDGLSLYFDSTRPGELGNGDIWVTTKQTSERNPSVLIQRHSIGVVAAKALD